jgi:hypothetical protein
MIIAPKLPQCAVICKDDTLLCIGTRESEILVYSLLINPGQPELVKTIKIDLGKDKEGNQIDLNVSAMASIGQKFILVGLEKGHL